MAITKETKTVYTCSDGKVFDNESDANDHESMLSDIKYYEIRYGADTCEGRSCLDKLAYVAVNAKSHHAEFLTHAMHKKFGSPITFAQGVFGSNAIMHYWKIVGECDMPEKEKILMRVEDRFVRNKYFGTGIFWNVGGKWDSVNA